MGYPDQQTCWTELPVVVFDFETTGPDPATASPVEVAAVRFEGGEPVRWFTSLLDPEELIPADATKVHGITDAMVQGMRKLADVRGELLELCDGALPCAYNEPYDRQILHRHLGSTECMAFDPAHTWLDVLMIVASPRVDKFVGGPGRLKLGPTCRRWDVELNEAHRALGDAKATGQLLYALLKRGKVKPCPAHKLIEAVRKAREVHERDHQKFSNRRAAERLELTALQRERDEARATVARLRTGLEQLAENFERAQYHHAAHAVRATVTEALVQPAGESTGEPEQLALGGIA